MIKIIRAKYECHSCGSLIFPGRELIIDEYLKKLEIPKPECVCGNKIKSKFILLDVNIEKTEEIKSLESRKKLVFVKQKILDFDKREIPLPQLKLLCKEIEKEEFNEILHKLLCFGEVYTCREGYIKEV